MPKNYTTFDALVDGKLRAVIAVNDTVTLWYLDDTMSRLVGTFSSETEFTPLIGGYGSVDEFNNAMAKRRGAQVQGVAV